MLYGDGLESQGFSFFTAVKISTTCQKTFTSLEEYDDLVRTLGREEASMRLAPLEYKRKYMDDPFFNNWYHELCGYLLI